jgi:transcriptional regulator with XRE-family HTH domain
MDKDNNIFDKEKFADLLDKAKGDRSINKYAEECDISAAHISRFLRQMINTPPTPETISKLSSKAYNSVSYRDLMEAAGHIAISNTLELDDLDIETGSNTDSYRQEIGRVSPQERRQQYQEIEKKFFQIILSHLYDVDYKWTIQKPEGHSYRPDMIIDIENDEYEKWLIDFKPTIRDRDLMGSMTFLIYGRLASMEIKPTDKITIALNSYKSYDHLFRRPPSSLRANLYVMLIDLDKGKILKEEKLCSYNPN